MKLLNNFFLLIFYLICVDVYVESNRVPEHYWRDYGGLIPRDAIEGGTDERGRATFVGQFTVIGDDLATIPGIIPRGSFKAIGAYHSSTVESTDSSNLKILCSNSPNNYLWTSISKPISPECRSVVGGYEENSDLLIGRINQDGYLVIGKVFADPSNHYAGLITPFNGKEGKYDDNYELLVYCK